MHKFLCVALLLCAALPAFAHEDESKIKAAVEDRFKEWLTAENKKDPERITSLYDDDAVLMPSKEDPVIGKAAISEWYERLIANPHFVPFTLTLNWNSFYVVNDIAITTSVFESDLTREGKQIHFRGKILLVWKKEKNRSWKIFRDMYDEIPAKESIAAK